MNIRIWQPEGEDYFSDANAIKLSVTTARDLTYEHQAQNIEELTLDLTTLTSSDTPLELELTATQEDDIYKGYVEAYELDWPTQDLTAVQEDPLMFVGPANKSVPLTHGYPPSLIDTMVCQTHQGALVLGTSVMQDASSGLNIYFMDLMGRALNSGPSISNIGTQARCALDADNHLYTYGGCIENSPASGLKRIKLESNATAEILTKSGSRSTCHSGLVVTAQHLWLLDGSTLELRNYEGQRQQALTLPTDMPFRLTHSADLESDQIWVWSTAPSENEVLRLVSQDNAGLTIKTVEIEGTLLYVGHNRHQQAICLTTEGLYSLKEDSPSLLMNASLIFEGNFQPTQFVESQPDRWVFINEAGSLFRLVQGSTNYDLPQDPARPQSQLFRGPGGAIFIAGGPSSGINLLITDTY